MEKPERRLSWPQIVGIALLAIVASAVASYLVQRFALGDPSPKVNVATIVGTTIPILFVLTRAGRKRKNKGDKPPV